MKPGLRTGKPMRSANREHFKPNQVLAGGCMRGFAPNPCDDLSASGSATVDRTTPQFERSRPCLTSALTGHFLPLPRNLHLPVPIPRTMTDPSLSCHAATRRDIVAIPIPPPACVEESFTPATPCRHTRETCSDNMQPSPPRINRTSWPASPHLYLYRAASLGDAEPVLSPLDSGCTPFTFPYPTSMLPTYDGNYPIICLTRKSSRPAHPVTRECTLPLQSSKNKLPERCLVPPSETAPRSCG
jgi:hypothetical protein